MVRPRVEGKRVSGPGNPPRLKLESITLPRCLEKGPVAAA